MEENTAIKSHSCGIQSLFKRNVYFLLFAFKKAYDFLEGRLRWWWASLMARLVKNLPMIQETCVSIPGSGRSPGEGNGNPLHYSCLENPVDRRAWWTTVHGVAKIQTRLSNWHFPNTCNWWYSQRMQWLWIANIDHSHPIFVSFLRKRYIQGTMAREGILISAELGPQIQVQSPESSGNLNWTTWTTFFPKLIWL